MTRKHRKILIDAYALLRIRAEQGESLAKALVVQDIGPTTNDRHADLTKLQKHTEKFAVETALLLKSIGECIGSTIVIDRAKFGRAKPLSKST